MRRILCLYLPNWPIQRLLAGRKKDEARRTKYEAGNFVLRPSSLVLLHARDPRRGELVVACNAAARQRGVRLAMPLAEAAALAGHGSHQPEARRVGPGRGASADPRGNDITIPQTVHILPHDPAADLTALARLAEHCERFSPIVGWETVEGPRSKVQSPKSSSDLGPWTLDFGLFPGPDCLFLDITGIGVLFGGEEALAREVAADLVRLDYEAHVAIADTIGAAWAAARHRESGIAGTAAERWSRESEGRVQGSGFRGQEEATGAGSDARDDSVLSTEYLVPSTGSCHKTQLILDSRPPTPDPRLPPLHIPHSALRSLSLAALRLPQETVDLLAQLGIVRIEQLLALPRASLRARFGERLLLRIDQLLGTAQETIVAHRPPPQFADEWLLEYPAERREVVEEIVRELVCRVARALADRREGVVQLACRLDCAPGRPLFFEVGLFCPSADPEHLWDLVRMQLEQTSLPGPVGRVTLQARLTAVLENRQGELFAGSQHEALRQLALLIDRLSSRLGPEAVLRAELTADPLPERAVRYVAGVRRQESGIEQVRNAECGVRNQGGARSAERGAQNKDKGASGDAGLSVLSTQYSVLRTKPRRRSRSIPDSRLPTPGSLCSTLLRPLMLHSPPLPLEVVSVIPDGPPVSFHWQGKTHRVARWWGPERIETGWWRGASARRDYWRVETVSGQRFWLFRCMSDGKWHLHGEFS